MNDHMDMCFTLLLELAQGEDGCLRRQILEASTGFDEPFRTAAASIGRRREGGQYVDEKVITSWLDGIPLWRMTERGVREEIPAADFASAIFQASHEPGQAEAYLDVLAAEARKRELAALKDDMAASLDRMVEDPAAAATVLRGKLDQFEAQSAPERRHATEAEEVLPFFQAIEARQIEQDFLGLDSGFAHVNNVFNGLNEGLIVIGAKPGLGKTTLTWQITQRVAEIEQCPVIFVSYEQSKEELRIKALARRSKQRCNHIARGRMAQDSAEWERVEEAAAAYFASSEYITIIEGDQDTTIDVIQAEARQKLQESGASRCLIIVDYLQIVPLTKDEAAHCTGPKDRADLCVSNLRRLARTLHSPVIAISSENRAGYDKKSGMDVFKESGGIEYAADVACVMTVDSQAAADASGKSESYSPIDLTVVKNRNGQRARIRFKFYPHFASFVEVDKEELSDDADGEEAA